MSQGVLKGNVISKLLIKNLHFNVLIQILFIPVQSGGAKPVPGMWQDPGGAEKEFGSRGNPYILDSFLSWSTQQLELNLKICPI